MSLGEFGISKSLHVALEVFQEKLIAALQSDERCYKQHLAGEHGNGRSCFYSVAG